VAGGAKLDIAGRHKRARLLCGAVAEIALGLAAGARAGLGRVDSRSGSDIGAHVFQRVAVDDAPAHRFRARAVAPDALPNA
jgi:hypothetical protein